MRAQGHVKCLVWDLDNTLWDGVLLEDRQVTLRPGVVDVLKTLDERGILHSIASRNDRELALQKLAEFGLREYFLHPHISWNPKSDAVSAVARKLNLGLDAFAFVDDQPFELDEVAFTHPDVLCVPADHVHAIPGRPEFRPRNLTDESQKRREMYRSAIDRDEAEHEFRGSSDEFLATLGMVLTIAPAAADDLKRAEELTVRTNQLNSTGVTYSYADLDRYRTSPDHLLLVASLTDRFGPYGKIGLALLDTSEDIWRVKLLLMSCRTMSRGVGGVLLNVVLRLARRGARGLEAEFADTGRNRLMYVTYRFAGFREVRRDRDVAVLRADLESVPAAPDYLRLVVEGLPW